jgi:sec-independent protein translocase protein TatA
VPNLGFTELIVILMILLLVFGGSRLPQIGESLGRTARSFKRGLFSNESIKVDETTPTAEATSEGGAQKPAALKAASAPTPNREVAEAELVDKKS